MAMTPLHFWGLVECARGVFMPDDPDQLLAALLNTEHPQHQAARDVFNDVEHPQHRALVAALLAVLRDPQDRRYGAAWMLLDREWTPRLRAALRRISPELNASDVEDLVQEALLRAYRHIGQFEGLLWVQLWAWILMIARRLGLREQKYRVRRPQPDSDYLEKLCAVLNCEAEGAPESVERGLEALEAWKRELLLCVDGWEIGETDLARDRSLVPMELKALKFHVDALHEEILGDSPGARRTRRDRLAQQHHRALRAVQDCLRSGRGGSHE